MKTKKKYTQKILLKHKNPFLCFYEHIICENCKTLYFCIPSYDYQGIWINLPKKCACCEKQLKISKTLKTKGYQINQTDNKKIKGQRLLLDITNVTLNSDYFSISRKDLEKIWREQDIKKIYRKILSEQKLNR